jgi:hypothetical protein
MSRKLLLFFSGSCVGSLSCVSLSVYCCVLPVLALLAGSALPGRDFRGESLGDLLLLWGNCVPLCPGGSCVKLGVFEDGKGPAGDLMGENLGDFALFLASLLLPRRCVLLLWFVGDSEGDFMGVRCGDFAFLASLVLRRRWMLVLL